MTNFWFLSFLVSLFAVVHGTDVSHRIFPGSLPGAPAPPNMNDLECAIHQDAYTYGATKTSTNLASLYAALNIDLLCPSDSKWVHITKSKISQVEEIFGQSERSRSQTQATSYYVATNGNDNNPGTMSAPFATLQRARDEIRKTPLPRPVTTVYIRGGTYYLNETLLLEQQDSYVTYSNYNSEKVTLSGGLLLTGLTWAPISSGSKIYSTKVPQQLSSRLKSPKFKKCGAGDPNWDCSEEQNVDFAGNDIATTTADSPDDCCSKCQQNPQCNFWTIESASGGTCWLKSSDAGRQTLANHVSGHPPPCSYEQNTDYAGNDLYTTNATDPTDCCNKCANYTGCKFWTIEHSAGGTCWLKSSDAGRQSYNDHVSGQIRPPRPAVVTGPPVVNSMFVNGIRMVRARYPNGNPQDITGLCFSNTQRPGEGCASYVSANGSLGTFSYPTNVTMVNLGPNRGSSPTHGAPQTNYDTFTYKIFDPPANHPVYNKPLPGIGWQNNSLYTFGEWDPIFKRSSAFAYQTSTWTKNTWANPETGVVHMFHTGLWGGWQFQMSGIDYSKHQISLSYGGFQEARGDLVQTNHFYVENIFEELDVPGEWFYDENTSMLYHYPNQTNLNDPSTLVVLPLLNTIVSVNGTDTIPNYATQIIFTGVEFTQTRSTFFEQYEAPPSGDWTVHRGATFFIQDAEQITVENCLFNQTGGNAILLSNHVSDSIIAKNEIALSGDSGIALLGKANLVYGTSPTYPNRNTIANNHIHDIGVYGKQVSCIASMISANSTISDNLCYNGPRAGINFNDGFGGNSLVIGNLVFNMVRETGDHGPYNSWDRQPYFTYNGINDGYNSSTCSNCPPGASIIKAPDFITQNFIINGYSSVWTIDHDDGSQFMNDTKNVMIWGGCKNYLGNSKSCDNNVIVYPGTQGRSDGDRRCQTDDNGVFANQYFHDNDCITQDDRPYTWSSCNPNSVDTTVFQTWNNRFYAPNSGFSQTCGSATYGSLQEWQKQGSGQDRNSGVQNTPDINTIIAMMNKILFP